MNKSTRAALAAIAGISLVCFASWLHGYDFDQRGPTAVCVFVVSLMFGFAGAAATFIKWSDL